MKTKQTTSPDELGAATGSEAHLAEDVSVGRLVRWLDREHINAARETPPNMDYMRDMQRLGEAVEIALDLYRRATKPLKLSRKADDQDCEASNA